MYCPGEFSGLLLQESKIVIKTMEIMKPIKNFAFLVIATLGMSSCDMFNVDVDTTMSGLLNIDVEDSMAKAGVAGYHFSDAVTLDPQEDEDVKKYADKIVEVGVGNITATVVSVSKSDVVILRGSTVTISANGKEDAIYTLEEDWSIVMDASFQLEDQGSVFYDEVSAILKDVEPFSLEMNGNSTVSGVTIGLKFDIDATVTGSIF
jgi:hypothetical protein